MAKKLISFSHDGNLYGAQKSQVSLLKGLQAKGFDILLVVPNEGDLTSYAKQLDLNAKVLDYPYPSSKPQRAIKFMFGYSSAAARIRNLVKQFDPEIIHCNTSACMTPAFALKESNAIKIWHLRESPPFNYLMNRWIDNSCDLAIANCQDTASSFNLLKVKNKLKVVHNGLNIEPPDNEQIRIAREEMELLDDEKSLIFAGNLLAHKDPGMLINVLDATKNELPGLKGFIFGSGPLLDSLENRISELGLESRIRLMGFKQNILPFVAASDVVLIPSLVEPFPRIGLEAMALGKAIIASNVGGMAEQTINSETGLLCPPSDVKEFSSALIRLITDQQFSNQLGQKAKQRYLDNFTEDIYVDKFLQAISKI